MSNLEAPATRYTPESVRPHPIWDGVQVAYRFPNGYGASVIRSTRSYGGKSGLWELAVLNSDGDLDYSTPITGDVLGHLDDAEVEALLERIEGLVGAVSGPYPAESLDDDSDNGTMPANVETLAKSVVGRKIVSVEKNVSIPGFYEWQRGNTGTVLTLDNGKQVVIEDSDDCCAYTAMEDVILHLDKIDHAITGIGTTDGYETWHIYADLGDVMEMKVGWSSGNPFYYGYGFHISVRDIPEEAKP